MRLLVLAILAALIAPAAALAQAKPGIVRVRIVTSDGPIVVALDAAHAPKTTANFLAYVDDGRLDGTSFFRAAPRKGAPKLGFIEGGIGSDVRRQLDPIPLESTAKTGIRHTDGAITMAREANPDSAMGNFSILVGAVPSLDAHGKDPGYAAFGHVIAGMDTVRRILAERAGGGSGPMKGQMILRPVQIVTARRMDGTPRPTGHVKPWLIGR